jgi:peptidoglycan hydrolase-like protein with peptidoglycan-binding domain
VQAPAQTLSPGATGSQVKILQRALASLGFSPGKADGDYGPSTQIAVEKFQVSKGLAEDGVVGQQTLAALQQALSG